MSDDAPCLLGVGYIGLGKIGAADGEAAVDWPGRSRGLRRRPEAMTP